MATCNYCSFQQIKRLAKTKGLKITTEPAKWGMGGINVYLHPKNIKINDFGNDEDGRKGQYRVSWFMELPAHCTC